MSHLNQNEIQKLAEKLYDNKNKTNFELLNMLNHDEKCFLASLLDEELRFVLEAIEENIEYGHCTFKEALSELNLSLDAHVEYFSELRFSTDETDYEDKDVFYMNACRAVCQLFYKEVHLFELRNRLIELQGEEITHHDSCVLHDFEDYSYKVFGLKFDSD